MTINLYIEKETYSRRLAYVVRIIARRLGYPYRLINDPGKIAHPSVTITYSALCHLESSSDLSSIIIVNSEMIHQLEMAEKKIALFEWGSYSLPVIGGVADLKDLKQWQLTSDSVLNHKKVNKRWLIPFDLYLNIFYHLSRFEEKWRYFTDETQTDHATSLLSRYDDLKNPVVDILIRYLDDLIRKKIHQENLTAVRVNHWPGGEEMGVALTHDVDITREINLPEQFLKKTKKLFLKLLARRHARQNLDYELAEKDALAWNFPELITFYAEKHWHATFFFLAKWLEGRHFRYNIRSKKFKYLFHQLRQAGHEIALHPSKFAFDKASAYRDEKNKLGKISGMKIQGMRQHYLRAKFPRLWVMAEKAGLHYDASLGYNFQSGFRAGTTFPFQTYDYSEEKLLSLTEFSLHVFEYNLPQSSANETGANAVIKQVINQVARNGGLFVALLHPSNYRREPYRAQWDFLLDELSRYRIYIASLSEHLKWRRQRERIKLSLTEIDKQKQQLTITLPEDLFYLSTEIIGGRITSADEHLDFEDLGSGCYRMKTSGQKITVTLTKNV